MKIEQYIAREWEVFDWAVIGFYQLTTGDPEGGVQSIEARWGCRLRVCTDQPVG